MNKVCVSKIVNASIVLILESVIEEKEGLFGGVPESYLYLALQKLGFDLYAFQSLMARLQDTGAIRIRSNLVMSGPRIFQALRKAKGSTPKVEKPKPPIGPEYCGCDHCLPGQQHLKLGV